MGERERGRENSKYKLPLPEFGFVKLPIAVQEKMSFELFLI